MSDKCFAAYGQGKCHALAVPRCQGYLCCPFYKTEAGLIQKQQESNARLRSLDKLEQQYIAGKYMGGTMPWKVELK